MGLSKEPWSRVHSGKIALISFIVGLKQMVSDLPLVPKHEVLSASSLVVNDEHVCVSINDYKVILINEY